MADKVIITPVTDEHDDQAEILGNIAKKKAKADITERNKGKTLMAKLMEMIGKGKPVTMTKEMEDLGIAQKVWDAAHKADRIKRLADLMDDDARESMRESMRDDFLDSPSDRGFMF